MNIYVTGADGLVGKALVKLGCRPLDCDITNIIAVQTTLESQVPRPDVVINLASKSDPDFCEKEENTKLAIKTNVRGAYNVAYVAERMSIPVIFMSTDHIFDGKDGPYFENETNKRFHLPKNFYGQTKLSMEAIGREFDNVKIVRTSTIFYPKRAVVELPHEYPTFLRRSFMYLPHFAESLYAYANLFPVMPKILNISGSETISWYEFGLAVASAFKKNKEDVHYRKRELKKFDGAPRPHKAGLHVGLSEKLGLPQHDYLDGIARMREDELKRELGFGD